MRTLPSLLWTFFVGWSLLWPFEVEQEELTWWVDWLGPRWAEWVERWADKGVHAALFFILVLLLRFAWRRERRLQAFLIAAGYGLVLEMAQRLISARSFELLDAVANSIGALAGTLPPIPRWERFRGKAS